MLESTLYDDAFYARRDAKSRPSAQRVVPLALELVPDCASVVDVGCGVGTWLSVFREHGVVETHGLEGPWVSLAHLRIPRESFRSADLSMPLGLEREFDLAMCLEVAEHLPESRAPGLVAELASAAPVVLFSAAVPLQGGQGHVNEQWPDYWADLFSAHGFVPVDAFRPRIWGDGRVRLWYRQNLIAFVRECYAKDHPRLLQSVASTQRERLSIVHPELYLRNSDLKRQSLSRMLRALPRAALNAVGRTRSDWSRAPF